MVGFWGQFALDFKCGGQFVRIRGARFGLRVTGCGVRDPGFWLLVADRWDRSLTVRVRGANKLTIVY
jgi:hypothetical protein